MFYNSTKMHTTYCFNWNLKKHQNLPQAPTDFCEMQSG